MRPRENLVVLIVLDAAVKVDVALALAESWVVEAKVDPESAERIVGDGA